MPDLAAIIPLVVSVLGALGIGSVIGQWAAGGKVRRAARAVVLDKLRVVEVARWPETDRTTDHPRLVSAIRELETAALLARVPRAAVVPYAQLAAAALLHMLDEVERTGDDEYATLSMPASDAIHGAAEIVSRAAWSPSGTRWFWLRRALRANRRAVDALDEAGFKSSLNYARHSIR